MCMITFVPAGIAIPWDGITGGAVYNDDGHGWAIASRDGLQIGKSMDFDTAADQLEKAYAQHRDAQPLTMFHSRWGTHGVMSEYNVHPFFVGSTKKTVVAHNGVMPSRFHPTKHDARSDTRIFVSHVLPQFITDAGIPSRRGARRIGETIGSGNKLVFLSVVNGIPRVRIVNAYAGVHDSGVWYSNTCYMDKAPRWRNEWSDSANWWNNPAANAGGILDGAIDSIKDCQICGAYNSVDIASNTCTVCLTCLDCAEDIRDCSCFLPEGTIERLADMADNDESENDGFIEWATDPRNSRGTKLA